MTASFAAQAALALQVAQAQEDRGRLAVFMDRDRIGRDLHDLVIQRLFAVGLTLENAVRLAVRPEVAQRITGAVDDIDATIKDIRRTIFELSAPAGSGDIRSALGAEVAAAASSLGFTPRLQTSGPVETAVGPDLRPHLLAVLRETLSNVSRHARASRAEVALDAGPDLVLTVTDDGIGLPDGGRRSGLRNLAERAQTCGGSFEVRRVGPEGGTVAIWRVPAGPRTQTSAGSVSAAAARARAFRDRAGPLGDVGPVAVVALRRADSANHGPLESAELGSVELAGEHVMTQRAGLLHQLGHGRAPAGLAGLPTGPDENSQTGRLASWDWQRATRSVAGPIHRPA